MNINYYTPKRKVGFTSLLSLEGIVNTDVFEIVCEAERIMAMRKLKERSDFFEKRSAVLFTDKPQGAMRVAFEKAAFQCGGQPIVISVDGGINNKELARSVILAIKSGVTAVFTDVAGFAELTQLIPSDMPVINADSLISPVFSLSALLAVKSMFGSPSDIAVTVVEDGKPSDLAIAFAKAQARLKIVCPCGADEKDIFYLSQFTTVSAAEKFDQKDGSKAIIYNSVSDKHLKSILSEGGEPTLLLSVENPLISELENAARQEPSYFVAAQAEYVFAAILSLLLEKESYGV